MAFRLLATTALLLVAAASASAQPKPKPATSIQITNARPVAATQVEVSAGEETVRLSKPLAPKARTTLQLPKMTGCTVTISAEFEDESIVELGEVDVCKEKTIRFVD